MKQDETLDKKNNEDFHDPEINPLDEIKNDLSIAEYVKENAGDSTEKKFVFSSMKSDKASIRRAILDNSDGDVEHISSNINAETRNSEELSMPFLKKNSSKKNNNKKSKKRILFFLVILIIMFTTASYYLLNADKDLSGPSKIEIDRRILVSALDTMKNLRTYSFVGKIKSKFTNAEDNEMTNSAMIIESDISGKIDNTDINYPKAEYNVNIGRTAITEISKTMTVIDMDVLGFGKSKNNQNYVRLNDYNLEVNIISAEEMENMMGSFDVYMGTWYLVEDEDWENIFGEDFIIRTTEISKISNLHDASKFVGFKEDLGDSKLNNIDVFHYRLTLNADVLADLYFNLIEGEIKFYEQKNSQGDFEKTYNMSIDNLKTAIKKYRASPNQYRGAIDDLVKNTNVEIWIGKTDKLVYRIKADLSLDMSLFSEFRKIILKDKTLDVSENVDNVTSEALNGNGLSSISIDFSMYDFDKPVEISIPGNAGDLSDFLLRVPGIDRKFGNDSEKDSDYDGLINELEIFYKTDVNNPDTDGDGYLDRDEVFNGYDPNIPGDARLEINKIIK